MGNSNLLTKELDQEIDKIVLANKRKQRLKVMENNNGNGIIVSIGVLCAIIILLTLGIYTNYINNVEPRVQQSQRWQQPQQPYQSQPYQQPYTQPVQPNPNRGLESLQSQLNSLSERVKWSSDRMVLLACLTQNNMFVLQNNLPKSEIILLNTDWTINRLPTRIYIAPEERAFLQKFVKPQ